MKIIFLSAVILNLMSCTTHTYHDLNKLTDKEFDEMVSESDEEFFKQLKRDGCYTRILSIDTLAKIEAKNQK